MNGVCSKEEMKKKIKQNIKHKDLINAISHIRQLTELTLNYTFFFNRELSHSMYTFNIL